MMCNGYLPMMNMQRSAYPTSMPYPQFANNMPSESVLRGKEFLRVEAQSQQSMYMPQEAKGLGTLSNQIRIGKLTVEQRRQKIERYRDKREKRVWRKKISYTCRKRVADQRIRIKGRFISKTEAIVLHREESKSESPDQVKVTSPENALPENLPSKIRILDNKVVSVVSMPEKVNAKKKKEVRRIFSITPNRPGAL